MIQLGIRFTDKPLICAPGMIISPWDQHPITTSQRVCLLKHTRGQDGAVSGGLNDHGRTGIGAFNQGLIYLPA